MMELQEELRGIWLELLLTEHLEQLDVHVMEYNPLIGGSYIKIPNKLARSKAIRNIQNTDEKCFNWSINAKIHPT